MNFLCFYALACSGSLSLFILLTSTLHVLSDAIITTYDSAIIYNMPVITRSQSKRASATEVLLTNSSIILPGSLISESTSISLNNLSSLACSSLFDTLPIQSISTTSDSSYHHHIDHIGSPLQDQIVSTSALGLPNFEISNCIQCQTEELNQFRNFSSNSSSLLCHNFETSIVCKMEDDCDDDTAGASSPSMQDLANLMNSWSSQLLSQNAQLTQDIHQVVTTNATFKQEIRSESDDLRALVGELRANSLASSSSVNSPPTPVPSVQVNNTPAPAISSVPPITNPVDQQSQMMQLFAAKMAKLSTALSEKSESKSDWPKFSGDHKKFRVWHLSIMAQLSLPPWVELYDSDTNDVVTSTSNSTLNGKLYSKLLLALEGNALKNVVARKHLRANGLLLLQELVQTYRPKNVPEVIAFKTSEFGGNTKRFSSESIDDYYNRFHDLLEDLAEADEPISTKSAIRHFIFTLGQDFETIQNNFRLGNLPSKWETQDWPTLLILCRDCYNSIKPHGITKRDLSHVTFDREAHQKKIKLWFSNPVKYAKEIESEQLKFPGKCLYHLSKSHSTDKCHIKRELDKTSNQSSRQPVPNVITTPTGQLRHITEDGFEDAEEDVDTIVEPADLGNHTNEESLLYFAHLSKHYLRLVTASPSLDRVQRHSMQYPVIADSGADYHMFRDRSFFEFICPAQGTVLLGDGVTALPIQGVGTVKCRVGSSILTIPNVRCIPELSESIYSLFQHIQTKDHKLESSYEEGLFVIFPQFRTKATIGKDDIYLDFLPLQENILEDCSDLSSIHSPNSEKCHHVTEFHQNLDQEISYLNKLLHHLRDYYSVVKTKRQLGMDVRAGFRRNTTQQQNYRYATPPRKSQSLELHDLDLPEELVDNSQTNSTASTPVHSNVVSDVSSPSISSKPPPCIPLVRSVDKVSSSLPKVISMSEDFLRGCVGFRKVDTMHRHFADLYQDTVHFDSTPPDAVLDPQPCTRNHAILLQFPDLLSLVMLFIWTLSLGLKFQ